MEAGAIDRMYVNLTGLTDYHSEAAAGGTDAESDAALLARVRERVQRPPTSGNGYQYRQWAMEVAGVGSAKVVELPGGPGTVGVTLVDSNDRAPAEGIVEAVEAHIREEMPIGPAVTVAGMEAVEIAVKYQGYIDRQLRQVAEQRKMENRPLPPDLDYLSLRGLRTEARQKLDKIRPLNLGQASRISGVSPADIAALMIHLERPPGGEGAGTCPAKSPEKETV